MHAVAACLMIGGSLVTAPSATAPGIVHQQMAPMELHATEWTLIQRTNAERARYGLPPLAVDPGLVVSARRHATWMTRSGLMQHTRANVAENIAMGQQSTSQVVRDWMNSPGHRANILNRSYRRIGVAAYRAPNGQTFWCQQFLW